MRARETRMPVGKIIELVGTSSRGFEDAINEAVRRSSRTVKNIRGVDVVGQKAIVKDGKVTEYRVNLKLSFGVE
ncbi:MAG TPA: dodecin family protein [Candidatus Angelobacter sp.]|nr:dodecin family protein [Candidatus Angelobacter sp.]